MGAGCVNQKKPSRRGQSFGTCTSCDGKGDGHWKEESLNPDSPCKVYASLILMPAKLYAGHSEKNDRSMS